MKRLFPIILVFVALTAAAGWWFRGPLGRAWSSAAGPWIIRGDPAPRPDAARYATMKKEVLRWRKDLSGRYAAAGSDAEREVVLAETRRFLETLLPEMMRCWLGTGWDFNGIAETPGEGKIACGYFVSTVLRDAGFRVDRYQLAQQPSQNILRTFLPRDSLSLRVGVPYESYAAELAAAEPGVHLVGLDRHVAFIVTRPDGFRFIHSSGSDPWCVVEEKKEAAEVLRRSNYRVRGHLTADKDLLRRWLVDEPIPVKKLPARKPVAGRKR